MSDSGQDRNQKATPKRMKEVRKKGGLGRSHDLSGWLAVGVGIVMAPSLMSSTRALVVTDLQQLPKVAADPQPGQIELMFTQSLLAVRGLLVPLFATVVVVVVVTQLAQGGVHPVFRLHTESLNLASGIKRLVSPMMLWEAGKTLLKSLAVGLVVFAALRGMVGLMMASGRLGLSALITIAAAQLSSVARAAVLAGLGLAVLDLAVVIRRNRKKTRMTLREVQDEQKATEADPHVKGAIRAKQRQMSRNRMMSAIADADVLVVNPTHVAVALRYLPGSGAPTVVAKGAGALAARLREVATEHRVPMVSDVPLARALYAACEVDQEIPEYLFVAVARVLAFVMALRRRGAAAGAHRSPGGTTLPQYVDADHRAVARAQSQAARSARRVRVSALVGDDTSAQEVDR